MKQRMLVMAIRLYRRLPPRKRFCPREGESCSARGLVSAQAGIGLTGVLAILATCTPQMGKHSPTCDFGP